MIASIRLARMAREEIHWHLSIPLFAGVAHLGTLEAGKVEELEVEILLTWDGVEVAAWVPGFFGVGPGVVVF